MEWQKERSKVHCLNFTTLIGLPSLTLTLPLLHSNNFSPHNHSIRKTSNKLNILVCIDIWEMVKGKNHLTYLQKFFFSSCCIFIPVALGSSTLLTGSSPSQHVSPSPLYHLPLTPLQQALVYHLPKTSSHITITQLNFSIFCIFSRYKLLLYSSLETHR